MVQNVPFTSTRYFFQKNIKLTYILDPFVLLNYKKNFLGWMQSCEVKPFSVSKWPICPKEFFRKTFNIMQFHVPLDPFHCAKFQKNFLEQIHSYEPSLGLNWSICPKWEFFSDKALIQSKCTSWPLSLCKIKKKLLEQIQNYKDTLFLHWR